MDTTTANRSARAAGISTAVLGLGVLAAPVKVAEVTGVTDVRALYFLAASDVVLAPGLIAAKRKRGWLIARAVANVVAAGLLVRERSLTPRLVAAGLAGLSVVDLRAAQALSQKDE